MAAAQTAEEVSPHKAAGKLAAALVGTHRRLRLSDVLASRERQAATRREALRDLTQVSEELGLHDA